MLIVNIITYISIKNYIDIFRAVSFFENCSKNHASEEMKNSFFVMSNTWIKLLLLKHKDCVIHKERNISNTHFKLLKS